MPDERFVRHGPLQAGEYGLELVRVLQDVLAAPGLTTGQTEVNDTSRRTDRVQRCDPEPTRRRGRSSGRGPGRARPLRGRWRAVAIPYQPDLPRSARRARRRRRGRARHARGAQRSAQGAAGSTVASARRRAQAAAASDTTPTRSTAYGVVSWLEPCPSIARRSAISGSTPARRLGTGAVRRSRLTMRRGLYEILRLVRSNASARRTLTSGTPARSAGPALRPPWVISSRITLGLRPRSA